ncbi:MAG: hypothetical protein OHK0011_14340 [Turneriella sp.]
MLMQKASQPQLTLNSFMEMYPWRPDETAGRRPLDYLWKFSLPVSPEEVWPFLIDTSTFNKLLGLPVMTYEERQGRLFGRSVNAGVLSEWEEVPWEWEYLKGLNNARIYSRGFATYVRSRYIIERTAHGTDLYVYFGWVPRSLPGRLLLKVAMPRLRADYESALAKVVSIIRERSDFESRQRALFLAAQHEAVEPAATERLRILSEKAIRAGANSHLLRRLADFLLTAPEEEIARIRLKALSRRLEIPLDAMVRTALYAAHAGILTLSWDVTCPHCRGVRKSAESLGDVPAEETCEACHITFSTEDIANLEVVFHVNPEIRRAEKKFYCAAEPATKRHILIQRRVGPGSALDLETALQPGEYRVRLDGEKRYVPVSVGAGAERRIVIAEDSSPLQAAEQPVFVYPNRGAVERTLIVERKDEDNDALRPAEVFGVQLFRDLFGKETLAPGLKIELGRQNILFTDIVGSTNLYLSRGDGEAFSSVRRHFQKTYEIVRAFNGAVVKTIGDSAMVAFTDSLQCLKAAVELQKKFTGNEETGNVLLRISIHAGPCLAVNLNSGVDYFGNTVNFAAKLQQLAGAREIAYSRDFEQDPRIAVYLRQLSLEPEVRVFRPSWAGQPYEIPVLKLA